MAQPPPAKRSRFTEGGEGQPTSSAARDPAAFAAMLATLKSAQPVQTKAAKVRMDEHGNLVDETGKILQPANAKKATLKINQHAVQAKHKPRMKIEKAPDIRRNNAFFDHALGLSKREKVIKKRAFSFLDVDGLQKRELRKEQWDKQHAEEAAQVAAAKAAEAEAKQKHLQAEEERFSILVEPPAVEWWDALVLGKDVNYSANLQDANATRVGKRVTSYVEHPVPIEGPDMPAAAEPLPLMLTAKERKRMRTQGRVAREKEKQEKIKLGLMEPPKPKVRISNLMRVMGNQATADPTQMEKYVRTEMEQRRQNHEQRNHARMLTPEQRKEKREAKMNCEAESQPMITVFKMGHLRDTQKEYKVTVNARQLKLTGCTIVTPDTTFVIIEGGRKPTKKYMRLLLHRIKWAEESLDAKPTAAEEPVEAAPSEGVVASGHHLAAPVELGRENWCHVVWTGQASKRDFIDFRHHKFQTSSQARRYLRDRNCEHIYTLVEKWEPRTSDAFGFEDEFFSSGESESDGGK